MSDDRKRLNGGEALESRILLSATWADFDGEPVEFDGDAGDNDFDLSTLSDGGFFAIHGEGGSDTIDLDQVDFDQVEWREGGMLIDLGDGESARIDFDGVESISFGDTTATVLDSGTYSDSSFSGSGTFVDGDTVFSVETSGNGEFDISYDTESDTLHVNGSSDTDQNSELHIHSAGPTDLTIGTISVEDKIDTISTDVDVDTIEFTDDAFVTTIEIDGGEGSLGTLRIEGDLKAALTIEADVHSIEVDGDVKNAITVHGDLDSLEADEVKGKLTIDGDAGSLSTDSDWKADIEIRGDLDSFVAGGEFKGTLSADRVEGSLSIEDDGELTTRDYIEAHSIEYEGHPRHALTETVAAEPDPDPVNEAPVGALHITDDAHISLSLGADSIGYEYGAGLSESAVFQGGTERIDVDEGLPFDRALRLDGIDGHVQLGSEASETLGGTATVSTWIRTEDASDSRQVWTWPSILGTEQSGGVNDMRWGGIDPSGHLSVSVGNSQGIVSAEPINDGEWHHVVMTRDADTGWSQVFIDGQLSAEGSGIAGEINVPVANLGMTVDHNGNDHVYLAADFAELHILDRVLDASEVSEIFASFGEELSVEEGEIFTLNADHSWSDPEGEDLTYTWTQVSGPSIELSDSHATSPTFTAPEGVVNTDLTFELSVSDGTNSTTDMVTVTVNADNDAPSVDAGNPQTVSENDTVLLSASASDPEDQGLSYSWTQTSGTSVTITDADSATPSFTAPEGLSNSDLSFEVTVSDGTNTTTDTVTITVNADNDAPTVDAGNPQTVEEGEIVQLIGTATDPESSLSSSIQFSADSIESYGGSGQDRGGVATVMDSGAGLQVSGNTWKSVPFDAEIHEGSVITFEFRSTIQGEIQGIGFDTDGGIDPSTTFKLRGTQDWGIRDYASDTVGSASEEWQTITIPVGEHFTGDFDRLVFVNDHDAGDRDSECMFRNIRISDGDGTAPGLTYSWTQTSGPSVTLENEQGLHPTFTAPEGLVNTDLTFELSVSDGTNTTTDTVTVTVNADNDAPSVDAGNPQTVNENDTVQLSASASDPEGQGLSYSWTQTSGTSVTITDADSATPSFTAPEGLSNSDLSFEVTVSDGTNTTTDTVTVTVNADNDAPSVDAGNPQTVNENDTVLLSASASDPEGQDLSYSWTQTSGTSVTITDADSATPSFTAPEGLSNSDLSFEVTVSDGTHTTTDTVTITVNADNDAPSVDAGNPQTVEEGEIVQLIGTATDPESSLSSSIQFSEDSIESYGGSGQDRGGVATVMDSGAGLQLSGNTWKSVPFDAEIHEGSVITFEFRSTIQGEIQGIGFDTDGDIDPSTTFKLRGTQDWGIRDYASDAVGSASEEWQTITIPVGEHFTGNFDRLVFLSDHDAGDSDGECMFRNVRLSDAGGATPDLTYSWTQTSGPSVTLDQEQSLNPTFTAPEGLVNTDLTFELSVSDGTNTTTDTVTITVNADNDARSSRPRPSSKAASAKSSSSHRRHTTLRARSSATAGSR
jgi:hypothetical protein